MSSKRTKRVDKNAKTRDDRQTNDDNLRRHYEEQHAHPEIERPASIELVRASTDTVLDNASQVCSAERQRTAPIRTSAVTEKTADLYTALLGEQLNSPITPSQVQQLAALSVLAHLDAAPRSVDNWTVLAAEAAIGAEASDGGVIRVRDDDE